jgi:hypothetical protein
VEEYLDQKEDVDFTVDGRDGISIFEIGLVNNGDVFDLFGANEGGDGG